MRVFISAGEASGDAYAAALVRELRSREPAIAFAGVGGARLAGEIGELRADSSRWGAISIAQSLRVAPRALAGYFRARGALSRGEPGLFIPIDFGFFNIRLAGVAKRRGWKVLYFIPPGSWRRDRQGRDLADRTDAVVTPFPWSAPLLVASGANARFLGHPLKQLVRERSTEPGERATIAVLPGSREHELAHNLPMIAQAARPEWRLEFAVAPNLDPHAVASDWRRLAPDRQDTFTSGHVYAVLGRARAAIVCSGTATLEAALIGVPMVVVYRVSKAMAREAKLVGFKMPDHISLPNIVLQRGLVPELVAVEIVPEQVRSALDPLVTDSPERLAQMEGFGEIDRILGPDDAIARTAEWALSFVPRR